MINKFISGLSAKEKKIALIIIAIVLVVLLDRLLLAPSMSRLNEINDKIVKEQVSIQKDMEFLEQRDQVVKDVAILRGFYTKEIKAEEQVIATLLKDVESMASQAKVDLSKISPAEQEGDSEFLKYLVTLDGKGSFDDILKFIYSINNSKELMRVEAMNLTAKKETDEVRVNLTVSKMIVSMDPAVSAKSLVTVQETEQTKAE